MPPEKTIPPELQAKVDHELEDGEQIQWIDMPVPRYFTSFSIPILLFGIPWTAISLYMMLSAGQKDFAFILFGIPFILTGIGFLSVPSWIYNISLHTVYVITNRRAITFAGGWSMDWYTTVRSYPPDKLEDIFRRDRSNETGDVLIARISWRDSDGDKQSQELGFLNIENPKDVEAMLKQLAEQAQ